MSRLSLRSLALLAGALHFLVSASSVAAPPASVEAPKVVVRAESAITAPDAELTVSLELTVAADGSVRDVVVTSEPNALYDAEAKRMVESSTFAPATKDGVAVAARIRYAVTFAAAAPPPPPDTPPPAPTASTTASPPPPPPDTDQATFGARAVTDAPPREVTARSMSSTELKMIGTRGDPIRAVELLPGMGRSVFGNPLPIIRGSSGLESQVFADGMPVPLLYHFGGITSFVPPRFLDRVDFYPGNFSARYGRVLGGVIDVRLRDPRLDGPHAGLDVNFIDASGFAEAPLVGRTKDGAQDDPDAPRLAAAVGFRRSWVDLYFSALAANDLTTIDAAPAYYDYQGIVTARFSRKHTLRLLSLGSQDRFELVSKQPADQDPLASGRFDLRTTFHRVQATLKSSWSNRLSQETVIAFGVENLRTNLGGIVSQDVEMLDVRARAEWVYRPVDSLRLTFGVDHASQHLAGTYEGPRAELESGSAAGPSAIPRVALTANRWIHAPALYAEAGLLLSDRVTLIPSVRVDYLDQTGSLTIDPRLAARAKITKTTTLKAGVGKFTQHPQAYQALPEIGNPSLGTGYAMHYSVGIEQRISDWLYLGAEGFYKTLHHIPINTLDYAAPYFDNAGRGSVVGLELEARVLPTKSGRFYGLLAYTLSLSERAREDQPLQLFQYDQTHVASVAGVVRLGAGWEASASFRLTSANPQTPVVSAFYDTQTDQYTPRSGAAFSDRGPLYHRLDLHIEKTWTFTQWKFMVYLDIQNVYNAPNREFSSYNYDYTAKQGASSFPPFLPSLGLRGEL